MAGDQAGQPSAPVARSASGRPSAWLPSEVAHVRTIAVAAASFASAILRGLRIESPAAASPVSGIPILPIFANRVPQLGLGYPGAQVPIGRPAAPGGSATEPAGDLSVATALVPKAER